MHVQQTHTVHMHIQIHVHAYIHTQHSKSSDFSEKKIHLKIISAYMGEEASNFKTAASTRNKTKGLPTAHCSWVRMRCPAGWRPALWEAGVDEGVSSAGKTTWPGPGLFPLAFLARRSGGIGREVRGHWEGGQGHREVRGIGREVRGHQEGGRGHREGGQPSVSSRQGGVLSEKVLRAAPGTSRHWAWTQGPGAWGMGTAPSTPVQGQEGLGVT